MNHLDLFSGIGGFALGLKRAGMALEWTGASEVDKYASSIYKRHFPNHKELGDVTEIVIGELPRIDILTAGFPCQDLSLAGKRAGLSGKRSGLFWEVLLFIGATRPGIFIIENVQGIFSSNGGEDFTTILKLLADLGIYDIQWQVVNTAWFLPQNRQRIYIIGSLAGGHRPEVFPFTNSDSIFKQDGREEQGEACVRPGQGSVRNGGETYVKTSINGGQGCQVSDPSGASRSITANTTNGPACSLNASDGGLGVSSGLYKVDTIPSRHPLKNGKPPSPVEVFNDIEQELINFYRVLRNTRKFKRFQRLVTLTPYCRDEYQIARKITGRNDVERARKWFVRVRQSFSGGVYGGWSMDVTESRTGIAKGVYNWLRAVEGLPAVHERLRRVQIDNRDFREIIPAYDSPDTLFYCDPPYIKSSRKWAGRLYTHEFTDADHINLVNLLLGIKGKAMVSGYDHEIYHALDAAGWSRREFDVTCSSIGRTRFTGIKGEGACKTHRRKEIVWMNYSPPTKGLF
jgi:site-specific DNA-cytosine methylase